MAFIFRLFTPAFMLGLILSLVLFSVSISSRVVLASPWEDDDRQLEAILNLIELDSFDPMNEFTEKLSEMNRLSSASNEDWTKIASEKYAEIGRVCSTGNERVKNIIAPIRDGIAGAICSVSVFGVGLGPVGGLVRSGINLLIDDIYERFTHEKEHDYLLNRVIENLHEYRKLNAEIIETEKKFRVDLIQMRLISRVGGRDKLTRYLNTLRTYREIQAKQLKEVILKAYSDVRKGTHIDESTLHELVVQSSVLTDIKSQLKVMIKDINTSTDEDTCDELRLGIFSLIEKEHQIQVRRKNLTDAHGQRGQGLWFKAMSQSYIEGVGNLNISSSIDESTQIAVDQVQATYSALLNTEDVFQEYSQVAYRQCVVQKSGLCKALHRFALPRHKRVCEKLAIEPHSEYFHFYPIEQQTRMISLARLRDQTIEKFIKRNERVKLIQPVPVNALQFSDAVDAFLQFFEDLQKAQTEEGLSERREYLRTKQKQVEEVCGSIHSRLEMLE